MQCVVTSPPYWGLRDYKVEGMIGLEKSFDDWLAAMVEVMRGVWRVLRDDGVAWVNIGDAYATQPAGNKTFNHGAIFDGRDMSGHQTSGTLRTADAVGLRSKNLIGMPWRLAFALQADGWFLRSDVIWHKPNPMPESVTDRPTKSHEYVFLLTKWARYFYDADATRVATGNELSWNELSWNEYTERTTPGAPWQSGMPDGMHAGSHKKDGGRSHPAGRNLRSVWSIPTQSFSGAHFATYPEKLVATCVKAGTSDKGCCSACGAPWVRVLSKDRVATRPGSDTKIKVPGGWETGKGAHSNKFHQDGRGEPQYRETIEVGNRDPQRHVTEHRTVSWKASCACAADLVPCTVLDPFSGAGTTGVVCKRMGLNYIGIELNPEYAEMSRRRIANPDRFGTGGDVPEEESLFSCSNMAFLGDGDDD